MGAEALGADWTEAGVDRLGDREGSGAGATLVVVADFHVREAVEVLPASLTAEPVEAGNRSAALGKATLRRELELPGLTDEDSDVGVRATLAVVRSSENGHEEDGGVSALLGGLAGGLDPVGVVTIGGAIQDGHQRATGEEEGENGGGGELVRALGGTVVRVVHG